MLVRIFKILSSFVLLAVLFSFVTQRDLSFSVKNRLEKVLHNNSYTKETSQITTPPNKSDVILATGTPQQESPVITQEANQLKPSPLPKEEKKVPQTETTVIAKQAVYEQLEESHSDTDESYKPVLSPCVVTMGFKIGVFDTRFGISQDTFIEEIQAGAKVWGEPLSKELFVYNPNGPLTINLIYDERQARTVDLSYLALEIENAKQAAENIRDSYEKEKASYVAQVETFTQDTETFTSKYKLYDDKVLSYNAQGGAPKEEYDKMMLELSSLQKESKTLEERRLALTSTMTTINTKVAKYNEFVIYVNTLIRKSNSLGAKKFTEGRFNPNTNTIDVYQFSDRLKLKRVIIHELGHVLGINHNDNIRSIMYSVNSGTTTFLSKEDKLSLAEACPSN